MTPEALEDLIRNPTAARLLRYLLASAGAVEEKFLTPEEREVAVTLEAMGLVRRSGEAVAMNREHPELGSLGLRLIPRQATSSGPVSIEQEVERLRSEHQEFQELLEFIQQLTVSIIRSTSVADLFDAAFRQLAGAIEFDVGVSVMLEQKLDVYLSRRENLVRVVDDRLIRKIRESLQSQIPVSFATTDAVVQSDLMNLPPTTQGDDPLAHHVDTILSQDNRIVGILALFRADSPFSDEERRLLELVSAQASMVLGNIKAQEKIKSLVEMDELTGIYNRRGFRLRLPGELERAKVYRLPLSLLMFDVDNFKQINDTHGHILGDVVLSEICGAINHGLRPPDTFARFGGDEFAILLPHTNLGGARSAAERILNTVRDLRVPGDNDVEICCTISVGVASFVPPDMSAADLVQRADDRLIAAKKAGKDRYIG